MNSKCCFDLKIGYYTYIIIMAGIRLSILYFAYHYLPFICYYSKTCHIPSFGWSAGWIAASVLFCLLALVGIHQKRSIIIYPYIIIIITEVLVTTVSLLILTIFLQPILLVPLFVILGFYGYDLWLLLSLYKKIKRMEAGTTNFIDDYEINSNLCK